VSKLGDVARRVDRLKWSPPNSLSSESLRGDVLAGCGASVQLTRRDHRGDETEGFVIQRTPAGAQ